MTVSNRPQRLSKQSPGLPSSPARRQCSSQHLISRPLSLQGSGWASFQRAASVGPWKFTAGGEGRELHKGEASGNQLRRGQDCTPMEEATRSSFLYLPRSLDTADHCRGAPHSTWLLPGNGDTAASRKPHVLSPSSE